MPCVELPLPDLALNGATVVDTGDGRVMLCRTAAGLHALRPVCPHQQQPLDGARIRGTTLTCPHHGVRFDLVDGRSLSPLTATPLELLPCRIAGDSVVIGS